MAEREIGSEGDAIAGAEAAGDLRAQHIGEAGFYGAPDDEILFEQQDAGDAVFAAEGFFGDRRGPVNGLAADGDVDVGAGEAVIGVGDLDEDLADLAAAEGDDLGGKHFDLAGPLLTGPGVPGDGDGLADGDASEFRFIDVDVNLKDIELADVSE